VSIEGWLSLSRVVFGGCKRRVKRVFGSCSPIRAVELVAGARGSCNSSLGEEVEPEPLGPSPPGGNGRRDTGLDELLTFELNEGFRLRAVRSICPVMDERRERPRRLRHGRRLNDGTVLVLTHDDEGRVIHAIRYDETIEQVLEELEGEAAEAAYGR
jgi:hypothetical protein